MRRYAHRLADCIRRSRIPLRHVDSAQIDCIGHVASCKDQLHLFFLYDVGKPGVFYADLQIQRTARLQASPCHSAVPDYKTVSQMIPDEFIAILSVVRRQIHVRVHSAVYRRRQRFIKRIVIIPDIPVRQCIGPVFFFCNRASRVRRAQSACNIVLLNLCLGALCRL